MRSAWQQLSRRDDAGLRDLAATVLSDRVLWETDLTAIPGLLDAVGTYLIRIEREGAERALAAHLAEQER
jgi:hypothetical protein